MQPESRDPAYFWDMLDAARSIQDFISSVSFEQYMQNRMMQLAVERQLETIGEAARRVSDGFKNKYRDPLEANYRPKKRACARIRRHPTRASLVSYNGRSPEAYRVTGTIDSAASVRQVIPCDS